MGRISLVSDPVIEPFAFPANCQVTDVVGDCVYVSADAIAGIVQVTKADITSSVKIPVRGVIISKSSPTVCAVVYYGAVNLAGTLPPLTPGKLYFVGSDSKPTSTRPAAPAYIQSVGVALDSSRLLFDPSMNLTKVI